MITLKKIEKKHLTDLYNVIYSSETPEWSKYNAPYFNDFKLIDLDTFLLKNHHEFYLSDRVLGIFLNNCKCQYKNVQKWQNKNVQLFKTIMIF